MYDDAASRTKDVPATYNESSISDATDVDDITDKDPVTGEAWYDEIKESEVMYDEIKESSVQDNFGEVENVYTEVK